MALWKLQQLKRWFEQKQGSGDNPQPPEDNEGDEGEGEGEAGDEGEPGDEHGDQPGDGEGEGEGDGGEEEGDGDGEGSEDGKGGSSQGHQQGSINPADYGNLDGLDEKEIRDPNVHVENEQGESSTPTGKDVQKPVIVIDPLERKDFHKPNDEQGTFSTAQWSGVLKSIRSGPLRLTLRRLMQRSDVFEREGGLRTGRLTGRGAVRATCGAQNVFSRRHSRDGEDVAVSILIDKSSSMWGASMNGAATTALLLGETAQNAGAKTEVVCFDSGYSREERVAIEENLSEELGPDSYRDKDWLYADASQVYVIKSFKQHIGELRRMFATLRQMASGGTHDASAVKWTGERLLKQPAARKILFVIADGEGDSCLVFRHVVTELESKGVIVIGIGIGCQQTFLQRFTHATTIQRANDLCTKSFGLLIGVIAKHYGL